MKEATAGTSLELQALLTGGVPVHAVLKPGTYRGPFAPNTQVSIEPMDDGQVILDGNLVMGVPGQTWKRIKFLNLSNQIAGQRPNGVVLSQDSLLSKCEIAFHGSGVAGWSDAPNSEVSDCFIHNNGTSTRDHGIYAQNTTGTKRILRNVVFNNYGKGIQVYGSDTARIDGFVIDGNACMDNGVIPNAAGTGYITNDPQNNIYVDGPLSGAKDLKVRHNVTYYRQDGHQPTWGSRVGLVNGAVEIADNFFFESLYLDLSATAPYLAGRNFALGRVGMGLPVPAAPAVVAAPVPKISAELQDALNRVLLLGL